MHRQDAVGICDEPNGAGFIVFLKLWDKYGAGELRFPTLQDAYRAILENVPSCETQEIYALNQRGGTKVMSKLPGDRNEWDAFFK